MKKIKWTGPKHYPSFGVCEPGQIVTEEQINSEVMAKWVSQGLAEWIPEPMGEGISMHLSWEDKSKKKRVKREV